MTNLIDGGSWWAKVENLNDPAKVHFWKVVAWERVTESAGGGEQLVAWVNGRDPVRSDRFSDRVEGWILNQFVHELPEDAVTSSWA
ncbi:MAG: hypothetical protein H0X12_02500 [Nocardioides sp.]|nr:hypothetical protein [Nocardioides sp.]